MGEHADAAVEYFMRGFKPGKRPRRPTMQSRTGNYMWRSRDGLISMYDMTEEHLRNAINVAEQYNNTGKLKQLKEVLEGRHA